MNFCVKETNFLNKEYKLLDFGCINEDTLLNQQLIQKAIDTVSLNGGGYLLFPAKFIKTGPIVLKSNVCLNLPFNCYLKFTKEKRFYTVDVRNWEGKNCYRTNSPISAYKQTNIGIIGKGTIDGCGDEWRPLKDWKVQEVFFEKCLEKSPYVIENDNCRIWYPSKSSYEGCLLTEEKMDLKLANDYYDFFRPVLLSLVECDQILLKDFISSNSPAWNIHPLFCSNLVVDSISAKNPSYAQNGDGIDVESCTNVEIKNSTFEVGDDGICIKSGKNKEARAIKRPTENVYIHDCLVYHAHGGIVIGSEMSRGIKNLLCENCTFVGTDIGIRFKSAIGRGGVVENITIKDINMNNIINEAIIFNMDYSLYKMAHEASDDVDSFDMEDIPYFKNIIIDNVYCDNAKKALKVLGINPKTINNEVSISNILIKDSYIKAEEDKSLKFCKNIRLANTKFDINGKETYFENDSFSIEC